MSRKYHVKSKLNHIKVIKGEKKNIGENAQKSPRDSLTYSRKHTILKPCGKIVYKILNSQEP